MYQKDLPYALLLGASTRHIVAAVPRWEPETVICIAWEPETVNRKGLQV
jgi:hypothetical protein